MNFTFSNVSFCNTVTNVVMQIKLMIDFFISYFCSYQSFLLKFKEGFSSDDIDGKGKTTLQVRKPEQLRWQGDKTSKFAY